VSETEGADGTNGLGPFADEQPSHNWQRGHVAAFGFGVSGGLLALVILGTATGAANTAGFSSAEIAVRCLESFAIGMAVMAVPVLLLTFAVPSPGSPLRGGRFAAMTLASLVFAGVLVVVNFVVWVLLALTLDPPSDDA
jgi:hypothetical protein